METTQSKYWQVPDRKVRVGVGAAAAATLIAWAVQVATGIDVPPGVEGAFAILITAVVQYFTRNQTSD